MSSLRHVRVGCEFQYDAAVDTPAVFQVEPFGGGPATVIRYEWTTRPLLERSAYTDLYGNSCQRLTLPAGTSVVGYDALVAVADATEEVDEEARELPPAELPDDVLVYTLPSRYVLPDVLGAEVWKQFGDTKPGYRRVQAIMNHVHNHLTFQYGSSTPLTTAVDVHASRYGVCRDFTHLALTYCRALSIPARYVFGYLPEIDTPPLDTPMDFAAWVEVYLEDRWWTFDPRNNEARKGRVLIGRGRDALDVAMATTFGAPVLKRMTVWADEVVPESGRERPSTTTPGPAAP
jgi:transglutaminase-like putative cysteine protease